MSAGAKNKWFAFLCGDGVVTLAYFLGVFNDLGTFALKMLSTLVLGAVGGLGGLLIKDFYTWYKNRKNKIKQP